MRKSLFSAPDHAGRWYNSRLAVIVESLVIGLSTGFVVVFFRYTLSRADTLRQGIYEALRTLPVYNLVLWILALVAAGLFLGWASKFRPMIKGSGIPQIKGALDRKLVLNWSSELPLKITAGILGIGAGLSLGREGPSIQIGAYVGQGVLSVFRRCRKERKVLIAAASAAGIAAAFNAPLAGVLFVLEELQPLFSPLFLACVMGASMTADAVAGYFFGLKPIFDFRQIAVLPLTEVHWVILLGILCGFLGDLFKRALYFFLGLYDRLQIPQLVRPVIPLLISIPLGFYFAGITGGGHNLIEALSTGSQPVRILLVLFAGKVIFTALCYGSGTAGGIFLPLLACGALAGDSLGEALANFGFIDHSQAINFLILGMAAFFSGVVKAPVTGIILILEMSGNFNHLGNLVLVSLSAFVAADLIGSRPVYSVLLERVLKGQAQTGNARTVPGG
ncbi:MAG: ClC family H(+)/Cl(-) exchange transporter [Treponema sp.]|jgi:H+/Cl- antiporter ClcA|nr:ClC family H(+)/Cl(-) exchange transporter [Treponema sp.]